MATIDLTPDRIDVRLTPAEKIWALRGDLSFPAPPSAAASSYRTAPAPPVASGRPDSACPARATSAPGAARPARSSSASAAASRPSASPSPARRTTPCSSAPTTPTPWPRRCCGDSRPRVHRRLGRAPAVRHAHPARRCRAASRGAAAARLRADQPRRRPPPPAAGHPTAPGRRAERAGIAVARYDRRGVGESSGEFLRTGFHDNVDDAAAVVAALRDDPAVDAGRMFPVGHSEGALTAVALAARGVPVAGLVLLSAPGRTGAEVLRRQAGRLLPTLPAPVRLVLRLTRTDLAAKVARNHEKILATDKDVAWVGGQRLNARWFREFLRYDPRPDLARVDAPILALTGDKDLQTDPADLPVIAAHAGGPVRTGVLPDVTHVLRRRPGRRRCGRTGTRRSSRWTRRWSSRCCRGSPRTAAEGTRRPAPDPGTGLSTGLTCSSARRRSRRPASPTARTRRGRR
ncbi:alpha/beta hydrolase [Micromonospora sp. BRA006-A]|nr:alpha/beta hydrolase [Micromonospora sp. BRA006-A]